jgi:hypothetical protein
MPASARRPSTAALEDHALDELERDAAAPLAGRVDRERGAVGAELEIAAVKDKRCHSGQLTWK